MEIQEREVEVCGQIVKITDGKPFSPPVHTVIILRGRCGVPSSVTNTTSTGMASSSSVASLSSVSSLASLTSPDDEWRRSVRELQSVGHRVVVVGLPGGCVMNKEEVIKGVLEIINKTEEDEEPGEDEEDGGNFIKVEPEDGENGVPNHGVSNGLSNDVSGSMTDRNHVIKPVVGVSLGTSSNYLIPLLDTPNQLAGWVNISPTIIPPVLSLPDKPLRTPQNTTSITLSTPENTTSNILPPTSKRSTIPLLILYGEEEVKSRALCERMLREGLPDNVRVSMVRGGGDLKVEHEKWVKLLKKFLIDL